MQITELQERAYTHHFERISKKYPYHMTKMQVCDVIGKDITPLEKMMREKTSPKFTKSGKSKQSAVSFTAYDVAMYLACGVTMGDYE